MPSAKKKLFESKSFKFALWTPLGFAILLAIIIGITSDLKLKIDYVGFNNLFIIFKFPLAIAALSFPLVALVASNHRSEQSAEQIRQSEAQNIFANYFKHRDEFESYCKEIINLDPHVDISVMHKTLFVTEDNSFSANINENIRIDIIERIRCIYLNINKLVNSPGNTPKNTIGGIFHELAIFESYYNIPRPKATFIDSGAFNSLEYNGRAFKIPSCFGDLLSFVQQYMFIVNHVFGFALNDRLSFPALNALLKMDWGSSVREKHIDAAIRYWDEKAKLDVELIDCENKADAWVINGVYSKEHVDILERPTLPRNNLGNILSNTKQSQKTILID